MRKSRLWILYSAHDFWRPRSIRMALLWSECKRGLLPPFSLMSTSLDDNWQISVFLYGIHLLVGSVLPSRCMGGSRTNENDRVFMTQYTITPIQRISTHKCVGSGFWCRENISEASNVGGARAKTAVFQYRYPAHSLQEKFYCKLMVPMETLHCEGVPCGGHNPPDINNPK